VPQSVDLREYVPHPVRALLAAPQLGKGAVIGPFLRADEAVQIIGIAAIKYAVTWYHTGHPSAVTLPTSAILTSIPLPKVIFGHNVPVLPSTFQRFGYYFILVNSTCNCRLRPGLILESSAIRSAALSFSPRTKYSTARAYIISPSFGLIARAL
jgi:hypothetical protein